MSLLAPLLGRASADPSRWTTLWEVLAPYGGRVTPSGIESWQRAAGRMDAESLRRADKQLTEAYVLLDTEAHARVVGYVARDAVFARRRFVRTLDAVIVAGPEAVARVAADPSALRSYDTVPVREPYSEPVVPVETLGTRIAAAAARKGIRRTWNNEAVGMLDRRRSKQWPSRPASTAWRDPEIGWLHVDASTLCADDGPEGEDGERSWYAAGSVAAGRLFRALHGVAGDGFGDQRPRHLRDVEIEIDLIRDEEGSDDADPQDETSCINDEGVYLTSFVHPEDARIEEFDARVELLTRHTAGALAHAALGFPPAEIAILQRVATSGV
ncbi:hypothetical protein ACFP63_18090 [Oerskovia jenensis]|uniref:Uncharacterized protein n=1 Tax=Oerskovia jenensis TaxID=162169 RepID=A0ABS2LFD0_9CELL|nr:hypothetical protein [Oerskovia jenensis]MBM7478834.1 hypothetical protein [Oerskovia jenensis]